MASRSNIVSTKALAIAAADQFCEDHHDHADEPWPYTRWLQGEYAEAIEAAICAVNERVAASDPLPEYRAEEAKDRRDDAAFEAARLGHA